MSAEMDGTRWQGLTAKQAIKKLEKRLAAKNKLINKLKAELKEINGKKI